MTLVTPETVTTHVHDSIKSILTRTTLSPEEAVAELAHLYRDHVYIQGTFETAQLSVLCGIGFTGTICGESRTIAVF